MGTVTDTGLEAGIARLRALDPGEWHRAAAAWSALADRLELVQDRLTDGAHALPAAWKSGLGADGARLRVQRHLATAVDAGPALRRIAQVLVEHAYALATLRHLADSALSPAECLALLARDRELDERTSAALRANRPPVLEDGAIGVRRPPPPEQVAAWWRSLRPEQRERLLRERPEVIGWLDGVSATDRDRANRRLLADRIEELTVREAALAKRLDGTPLMPWESALAGELVTVRSRLAGLEAVRSALRAHPGEALLLGVDAEIRRGGIGGEGRVVIALGDPDRARHTAILVPGVNSDQGDAPGGVDRVARLWRAADALTAEPGDVCAVYWLGYDAPGTLDALSWEPSRAGGGHLGPFVAGLQAAHDPSASHVTIVGHSYGSTVVAEAALHGPLEADDIVVVGSPGMHTDRATDLGLDPRHVWGGLAPGDPVGGSLGELAFVHGEEPTDPGFGANRFVVDTQGHNGYWDPGSLSLRNQAAIVVGRYDAVGYLSGAPPRD